MYGIPAAAAVGASLSADQDFSQIAASPARNYVLVSTADGGTVFIYTAEHGLIPIDGAGSAPDLIVLSPRGSAAALWFSSLNQLQVITGLPDDPRSGNWMRHLWDPRPRWRSATTESWLAGTGPLESVYAFGPNGEVNRLPVENVVALLSFRGPMTWRPPRSRRANDDRHRGFAVVSNLLTSVDSSLHPIAVATTSDNRTLVLRGSQRL